LVEKRPTIDEYKEEQEDIAADDDADEVADVEVQASFNSMDAPGNGDSARSKPSMDPLALRADESAYETEEEVQEEAKRGLFPSVRPSTSTPSHGLEPEEAE